MVAPLRSDVALPWRPPEPRKPGDAGRIELENFEYRALAFPIREPGRYSNLAIAADGQMVFSFVSANGSSSIKIVNFKGRDVKTLLDGFGDFKLSADGKKLVVRQDNNLALVELQPKH